MTVRPLLRGRDAVDVAGPERRVGRLRPAWWREVMLVAVLYEAYDTTRGLRRGNVRTADGNGGGILRWEHILHLDPEHTLNVILWDVPALGVAASYFYATLHFVVTPAVLIWLYRRHPRSYRSARTVLAVATCLALIGFWLLPTAPPRLLPGGQFHDILASTHQWGWWGGEGSVPRGLGGLTNQLAAMPSLHVAWALWSGGVLAVHARRRAVRVLGAAYPVLTALVVMGTGNHYFFDTLGGAAVVAIGIGAARLGAGRRSSELSQVVSDRFGVRGKLLVPARRETSRECPQPDDMAVSAGGMESSYSLQAIALSGDMFATPDCGLAGEHLRNDGVTAVVDRSYTGSEDHV
jgi:PAP2 superfamily